MSPEDTAKEAPAPDLARIGTLAELYAHVRDGGRLEVRSHTGWTLAHPFDHLPTLEDDLTQWRKYVIPRSVWMVPDDINGGKASAKLRRVYYSDATAPPEAVEFREVLK